MQETTLYYTVGASSIRYCLWIGIFMLQSASSKRFRLVSFPLSNVWSESLHSQCFLISIVFVPERHLNIYDTRCIRLSVLRALFSVKAQHIWKALFLWTWIILTAMRDSCRVWTVSLWQTGWAMSLMQRLIACDCCMYCILRLVCSANAERQWSNTEKRLLYYQVKLKDAVFRIQACSPSQPVTYWHFVTAPLVSCKHTRYAGIRQRDSRDLWIHNVHCKKDAVV